MATYYHNPKCSKSRQGLEILEQAGFSFKIKEYLKEPMTTSELEDLFFKLKKTPEEVIRKKEDIYKELNLKDKDLSSQEWIKIIIEYPKLLERPILLTENQAIIGRPVEELSKILK